MCRVMRTLLAFVDTAALSFSSRTALPMLLVVGRGRGALLRATLLLIKARVAALALNGRKSIGSMVTMLITIGLSLVLSNDSVVD